MERLIIIANDVGNRKGCISSDFFPICLIPDDASALVICNFYASVHGVHLTYMKQKNEQK